MIEPLRAAYEALAVEGSVEPLVALVHPQLEWRGRRRSLVRLWQPPPS